MDNKEETMKLSHSGNIVGVDINKERINNLTKTQGEIEEEIVGLEKRLANVERHIDILLGISIITLLLIAISNYFS